MSTDATATDPQKVELLLSQLSTLPTLAPVALRLLNLTSRLDSELRDVVRLIESDASLAAQVLSHARRADRAAISADKLTVERAAARLGFHTLRQIVLTSKVIEVFSATAGRTGAHFNRAEFWKHCLAVACAAKRIAMRIKGGPDAEDAFIAGLLHDLGKIAFDACIPKSYDRVMQEADRRRGDLLAVERDVLGTDHTIAGRRVAQRWRLPEPFASCVWLHHLSPDGLPTDVRSAGVVPIVWFADIVVRRHRLGFSGNHTNEPTVESAAAMLGLTEADVPAIMDALAEEIEQRAACVGLEDVSSGRMYLQALSESARDLSQANEAVRRQNHRLSRRAEYFAALCGLHREPLDHMPLAEGCCAAAEAVVRALGLTAALAFARDGLHAGWHVGTYQLEQGGRAELLGAARDLSDLRRQSVEFAESGTWITPAPDLPGLADALANLDARGTMWWLPIIRERQWVAAAVFAADPSDVAAWRTETVELEALSTGLGAMLGSLIEQRRTQRLDEQLVDAQQRLAAIQKEVAATRTLRTTAEIAAGAAHELNTPLALISGRAQMLRADAAIEPQRKMLDDIVDATRLASDIVSDLMAFAEPGRPNPQAIALAPLAVALVDQSRAMDTGARTITLDIPSALPPVLCDPQHLRGAIQELLRNAVEATSPDAGTIDMKARFDSSDETIALVVADNGRGMTPEVRDRAFDPFFSARPAGRGRGMGLSRVHRWMQANAGRVTLDNPPDGGTIVTVRLPATRSNA